MLYYICKSSIDFIFITFRLQLCIYLEKYEAVCFTGLKCGATSGMIKKKVRELELPASEFEDLRKLRALLSFLRSSNSLAGSSSSLTFSSIILTVAPHFKPVKQTASYLSR